MRIGLGRLKIGKLVLYGLKMSGRWWAVLLAAAAVALTVYIWWG